MNEEVKSLATLQALPQELVEVRELEGYDGPFLSQFRAKVDGTSYIAKWATCDVNCNRWIYVRVSDEAIISYLCREMTLLSLLTSSGGIGFLVDLNGSGAVVSVRLVFVKDLPEKYLPQPECKYAPSLCPNAE